MGPFFAVERWDPAAPWRPFADLALDPVTLAERVEVAAAVLERTGPVPRRVVASVYSLGVVSRLVSPVLAAAALDGTVPVLGLDTVGWQPVAAGPMPIAYRDGIHRRPASADAIVEGCLEPTVRPFLTTLGDRYRVSPHVLWGNAASAVGGAYAMLKHAKARRTRRRPARPAAAHGLRDVERTRAQAPQLLPLLPDPGRRHLRRLRAHPRRLRLEQARPRSRR